MVARQSGGGEDGAARATLVDVAAAAGVSRQTVSNVVNAPERVSAATAQRVQRHIDRLGFRPNTAAQALRRRRAAALGLQVSCPDSSSLGTLAEPFLYELTAAARARGVHVVTFSAADPDDPTAEYERLLAVRAVDGFLLTDTRRDDPRPGWLRSREVPYASFGRIWDEPEVRSWVDVDGCAGVAAGVRHLAEQGYRTVGFLGWPQGSPVGEDRRTGWLSACEDLGWAPHGLEARAVQDVHAAAVAAAPLLDRLADGGALVCASDTLALGAWTALRERGLRPGVDVGVVGFDDSAIAEAFDFTSLRQPLRDIALTMLAMLSDDEGAPSEGALLQPAVVARASTDLTPPAPPVRDPHPSPGGNA